MKAVPSKSRRGLSITRQQALVDYVALGGKRSLRRLVQYYDEIRKCLPTHPLSIEGDDFDRRSGQT
jgi:hypothetical protein